MRPLTLDKNETATVLAALRLFQKTYEGQAAKYIRKDWPEHFVGVQPLGTEDITDLCERINCGELTERELRERGERQVRCPDHRNGGATSCPAGGAALQIWQRKQWGD
jgi:hypothetical protein